MSDLECIKAIKQTLGIKLRRVGEISWNKKGYLLNSEEQIIGLALNDLKLNDLSKIIEPLAKLSNLQKLYLSKNQFSDLTPLAKLTNLQKLDLQNNQVSDLVPLNTLSNLQELDLRYNQVSDLTPLATLNNLQKLDLQNNQVSDLVPLTYLSNLQELDLRYNQFSDLTPLATLNNLQKLDLSRNQVSDLEPLATLTSLQKLYLSRNQVSELQPLAKLSNLQQLDLSNNQVSELQPLAYLSNLKKLYLFNNQISELQPLAKLSNLQKLDLSNNQISELEPLAKLSNLQQLNLYENQISELQPLAKLSNLQQLYLRNNQVSELQPLKALHKLSQLSLNDNPIKTLPSWITNFLMDIQWDEDDFLDNGYITFYNNPLETPPPEIVKQGKEAVKNYFKQLEVQNEDYLFEAKLLILGEAGAGKTSMAWKLENPDCLLPKEEDTTRGIDVLPIKFPIHQEDFPQLPDSFDFTNRRFRMNVWDFGGQEIYKATHRFFLNKRSLYALVADNRKEDAHFYYWLSIVEMFGGDSPLLIVQNEKQSRKRDLDICAMKGRFKNLQKEVQVNFANNDPTHLKLLEQEIRHLMIKLPHVGSKVPANWKTIRDKLELDKHRTISLQDYLELCKKESLEERKDALTLSQYFHDIGVFLHFQDDSVLKHTVFLNDNWATNAIYKLLDHPLLDEKQGRFTRQDAELIWQKDEYAQLHDELLRLMHKFFLCYKVEGLEEYIVPDKLPGRAPVYEWDEMENLRLKYDYDIFMPRGILPQFIVEMNRFIADHQKVWKRGCLLEREGAKAEVIESYDARTISTRISGKNKRDFMTVIVDQLDRINAQYEKMKVEKLIPCNCEMCNGTTNPYFYQYSDLKRRIEKDRREVECGKSYEMVNVRQLIDDVLSPQKPTKNMRDKKKIFVSYSRNDKSFLARLQTHVKVLEKEGVELELWSDTQIKAGKRWREEIEHALASAGVAVMLVSTDFLASDFIRDNELPPLLKAAENEGTTILSLILKPCRFAKSPLSIFQAVNDPNVPLAELSESDQEKEYLKLVERIEELLGK